MCSKVIEFLVQLGARCSFPERTDHQSIFFFICAYVCVVVCVCVCVCARVCVMMLFQKSCPRKRKTKRLFIENVCTACGSVCCQFCSPLHIFNVFHSFFFFTEESQRDEHDEKRAVVEHPS